MLLNTFIFRKQRGKNHNDENKKDYNINIINNINNNNT